jgi:hypothetical protein
MWSPGPGKAIIEIALSNLEDGRAITVTKRVNLLVLCVLG